MKRRGRASFRPMMLLNECYAFDPEGIIAGSRRSKTSGARSAPPQAQGRIPKGMLAPWFVHTPASEATEHSPTASMPPACTLERARGLHVIQGSFDPWLPSMIPSGSWIHSPSAK